MNARALFIPCHKMRQAFILVLCHVWFWLLVPDEDRWARVFVGVWARLQGAALGTNAFIYL